MRYKGVDENASYLVEDGEDISISRAEEVGGDNGPRGGGDNREVEREGIKEERSAITTRGGNPSG